MNFQATQVQSTTRRENSSNVSRSPQQRLGPSGGQLNRKWAQMHPGRLGRMGSPHSSWLWVVEARVAQAAVRLALEHLNVATRSFYSDGPLPILTRYQLWLIPWKSLKYPELMLTICASMIYDMGPWGLILNHCHWPSLHLVAAVRSKSPALRTERNHLGKATIMGQPWTCWEKWTINQQWDHGNMMFSLYH